MSRSHSRGRRRGGHGGGEESEERWLLTYADMITLLMALFMVLFSISSVNISKYQTLQQALHAAFSGDILPGGKAIAKPGATANKSHAPTATDIPTIVPVNTSKASAQASKAVASKEASEFTSIKHQLDSYAAKHGFSSDVHTSVEKRGLVIRVLTDRLLFPSGQATLIDQAAPLLKEIAALVNIDRAHPIAVEGNTDNQPIRSATFPSNWELSTARASTVVRYLISQHVGAHRLSASGYAALRPIAGNATVGGRARNRRVEIVLQRLGGAESTP